MNTNRQIEILELIINCLTDGDSNFQLGIFSCLSHLYFTDDVTAYEYIDTKKLLRINRPTENNQYKEFFKVICDKDIYWWKPINLNIETKQIRIDYLNKLLSNIK